MHNLICEVCGRVEGVEDENVDTAETPSMVHRLLHVCEDCRNDRVQRFE